MDRKPPRCERKTVIVFNEDPDDWKATVTTYKPALIKNLEFLAKTYPKDCLLQRISRDGLAVEYIIPKKWVKIVARHIYSDAALESKAASYKRRREEYFAALEAAEDETPAAAPQPQPGDTDTPPQENAQ